MNDRPKLKRIATVRRLRQAREKISARNVAACHAAVEESARILRGIDGEIRALQEDLGAGMKSGIAAQEISLYHGHWISLRERRKAAAAELARARERLRAAGEKYRADRIERKRLETWEENVEREIRASEDRKRAAAADEHVVLRHGW